jgi:NAD dependent epimerase/dehydratase family enzyme
MNERRLRASVSIELFHLNEGTLIRDRRDLHVAIRHSANRIEELEAEREATGALTRKQQEEYDRLINLIGERINASAPFSSFARASLKQSGDRGWNTELLMTV